MLHNVIYKHVGLVATYEWFVENQWYAGMNRPNAPIQFTTIEECYNWHGDAIPAIRFAEEICLKVNTWTGIYPKVARHGI